MTGDGRGTPFEPVASNQRCVCWIELLGITHLIAQSQGKGRGASKPFSSIIQITWELKAALRALSDVEKPFD